MPLLQTLLITLGSCAPLCCHDLERVMPCHHSQHVQRLITLFTRAAGHHYATEVLGEVLKHLTRSGATGQRVLPACAAVLKDCLCLDLRPPCMPAQNAAWDVDLMSGVVISQLQVQASAFTSVSVLQVFSVASMWCADSSTCMPAP